MRKSVIDFVEKIYKSGEMPGYINDAKELTNQIENLQELNVMILSTLIKKIKSKIN